MKENYAAVLFDPRDEARDGKGWRVHRHCAETGRSLRTSPRFKTYAAAHAWAQTHSHGVAKFENVR